MTTETIAVTARDYVDADNCLAAAEAAYIATHHELRGWDLSPRWEDDERETILLTVPTWASRESEITDEQIEALRAEAAAAGDSAMVTICDSALAYHESSRIECARVIADAAAQGE
ncbi:MAG: hypothetical protein KC766_20445 [Myxococcales bacterium]|nr:hypothetical protein [Myxococcales bacterium]